MIKQTFFQDLWLTGGKYKLFIAKTKYNKIAQYTLCKCDILFSSLVFSALNEHVHGHKHQERVQSRNQNNLSSYFLKTCPSKL